MTGSPGKEAVADHLAFMADLGREASTKGYMPPLNMVQAFQAEEQGSAGGASVSELHEHGNAAMRLGQHEQARQRYTEALEAIAASPSGSHPKMAVLFSNRAAAALKLGDAAGGAADAEAALRVDPAYVKGWFRLAAAAAMGGDRRAMRAAATRGLELEPNNRELREMLAEAEGQPP
eukprot:jgi/Tetstr1/420497/TSEL_011610.t1